MNRSFAVLAVCAFPCWSVAQQPPAAEPPVAARTAKEAIDAGIAWLLAHQEEAGGWSASQFQRHDPKGDLCTGTGKPDQDLHVTAWATLAMAWPGDTKRTRPHRQPVQKALAWLRSQQQKDGFVGTPEPTNAIEAHALACLALADGRLLNDQPQPAEALARTVALRLPDGTWPARIGAKQGDPLATYWAGIACLSGAMRQDLEPALAAMAENKLATAPPPSAEAMLRWMARHHPATDARLAELMAKLGENPPLWREGADAARMDFLEWQLGTHAMHQARAEAWRVADWQQWYRALLVALVPHQRTDGAHAGSWDPVDARGREGGRVYATAVNVMSLVTGQLLEGIVDREAPAKKK